MDSEHHDDAQIPTTLSVAQCKVLRFIDNTFDRILSEITKRPFGDPRITLQRIRSLDVSLHSLTRLPEWKVQSHEVNYRWPGRTRDEAWRFACVGGILVEIQTAIRTRLVVTKRDIFYHNIALFKTQDVVDRYIDDIAHTCEVSRQDLNISASPKGIYIGLEKSGQEVKLISGNETMSRSALEHVRWVLVVEKEATFNNLIEQSIHVAFPIGPGIIMTGRGYPDLATRRFLWNITNELEDDTPIYGLFDVDPDGLDIMRCYAVGSKALAQEVAFCVPRINWLGVKLEDITLDSCAPLTARDRSKAYTMLAKSYWCQGCPGIQGYHETLQKMLVLGVKAEIQALEGGRESCIAWLLLVMSRIRG